MSDKKTLMMKIIKETDIVHRQIKSKSTSRYIICKSLSIKHTNKLFHFLTMANIQSTFSSCQRLQNNIPTLLQVSSHPFDNQRSVFHHQLPVIDSRQISNSSLLPGENKKRILDCCQVILFALVDLLLLRRSFLNWR